MPSFLVVLIIAATVTFGALNLRERMRGARRPLLIGAHLLLAIGGLEALASSGALAEAAANGGWGRAAAALLATALGCGLLSAALRRSHPPTASGLLGAHAVCGAAGLVVALGWAWG